MYVLAYLCGPFWQFSDAEHRLRVNLYATTACVSHISTRRNAAGHTPAKAAWIVTRGCTPHGTISKLICSPMTRPNLGVPVAGRRTLLLFQSPSLSLTLAPSAASIKTVRTHCLNKCADAKRYQKMKDEHDCRDKGKSGYDVIDCGVETLLVLEGPMMSVLPDNKVCAFCLLHLLF
jgi:hypothetical protein